MNFKKINPVFWVLLFSILVSGWPFIGYRFTDGDVSHWISIAGEIRNHFTFLTSNHDQFHGPFLAWFTALFTLLKPNSFYLYNLTNAGCYVLIVWLSYFFSEKIFKNKKLALFNTVLTSTGLMLVYLSRTPMYDLPAAAFYFSFTGFYYLALKEKKDHYFWLAMASIGIASLSRFSISLGIAGVYMIGTQFLFRMSLSKFLKKIVSDGAIIILAGVLFNLPWIAGQIQTHGLSFLNGFYDDNVGRYLIEKTAHPKLNREYWAFPLYALIGMLPYTFLLLATIFKKGFWKEIKKDDLQKILLFAFVPGLLLFSFSGHVKLGRYIAFVFPSLSLWLGYRLFTFELKDKKFIKRALRFAYFTLFLLGLILFAIIASFKSESSESGLLILSFGLLLFLSNLALAFLIKRNPQQLINKPLRWLGIMAVLYICFFSVLNSQAYELSFLKAVNQDIQNAMGFTVVP